MVMSTIVILLVSVLLVLASITSVAQDVITGNHPKMSYPKDDGSNNNYSKISAAGSESQNIHEQQNGLPNQVYISNKWTLGKIVLHDGRIIDNYFLRYNFLTDQIQFIAGKDTLVFANPLDLNIVTFDGHTFVYENYYYQDSVRQGYFELIVPGKNKLMLKRIVTSQKPDSKYPLNESLTKYEFDECYFISKPGVPANKLACNRKSVLRFLNEHNEDISEYLRITGNKVRTIEDLKLLVSYYNSLDEEY